MSDENKNSILLASETENDARLHPLYEISRESEDRYRAFINQNTEGIWRIEFDEKFSINQTVEEQIELAIRHGYLAECNDATARMRGLEKADDLAGSRIANLFDLNDAANVEYLRSFIESGYNLSAESHGEDACGNEKYFLNGSVGTVENGFLVRVWGTQRDITEQKRAEQSLLGNEERYRALVEATSTVFWQANENGELSFVGSAWENVSGQHVEETLGAGWLDALHPDDRENTVKVWQRTLAAKSIYETEFRVLTTRGEYRWFAVRGVPVLNRDGSLREWIGANTDVHEHKLAEEKVHESEARFRQMADYAPVMVWMTDATGYCNYLSQSWYEFTGQTPETGLGFGWLDATHPDDLKPTEEIFVHANERRAPFRAEYRLRGADGSYVWAIDSAQPRFGEDGEYLGYIGSVIDISERKAAEEKVRESEANFRQLAEAVPQFVWVTEANGSLSYVNEQWLDFSGLTLEQMNDSQKSAEIFYPDDVERLTSEWKKAFSSGETLQIELRLRNRRGEYRWFLTRSRPVKDADGKILKWFGTSTDITDVKEAQAKIRESEERLQLAVDISRTATFNIDLATDQVQTDSIGRAIYGFEPDEPLTFARVQSRFHPEDLDEVLRRVGAAFAPEGADEFEVEQRIIRTDGETRWIRVRGRAFFEGANEERRVVNCLGTYIDITQSKLDEESLRERERLALLNADVSRALIKDQSLPDILCRCTDAVVEHLDAAFARIWTLDKDENVLELQASSGIYTHLDGAHARVPVGKFKIGIIAEDRQPHLTNAVVGDVRVGDQEWAVREKMVAFAGYPLLVEDRLVGVVAMFARQPLTEKTIESLSVAANAIALGIERKHTESERERLLVSEQQARGAAEEANRAKDEFIALVSHELRSPLNAMLGWTRILQNQNPDEQTKEYALDVIIRNARSQSRLIEDLLDIARVSRGKLRLEMEPTELMPIINQAVEIVKPTAEASGVKISLTLDRTADQITGDVDRLRQVIENLLSNAVKFTASGGNVAIRLERAGKNAKIIVTDTGQGISRGFLPQIFERFKQADPSTTRRHGGLGIGLSLARDLVDLHGGTITAESAGVGEGSTFTITLPLRAVAESEENSGEVEFMDAQGKLSGFWILAVDDEADARELVSFMLQVNGAKVTTANSAVEALDILKGAEGRLPDILLSDISMPNESGYALLAKIRALPSEHGGQIPAVALTAFSRPEDRQAAYEAGFQKHLGKPVEPDDLISAIIETAAAR